MTFADRMQADGWQRLQESERNEIIAEISSVGDAQYRRGPVTLSISNGTLYEGKHGQVGYFDELGLILNAIVVDDNHRHQGHGKQAMQSLIAACNPSDGPAISLKLEAGWLGRGLVDEASDLSAEDLIGWYRNLGFELDPEATCCMAYQGAVS